MSGKGMRFGVLAFVLVLLNAAGIFWIHHDLTTGRSLKTRVLSMLPSAGFDTTKSLALVFDEPLVGAEQVGKTLDHSPFVLLPAVAGSWQWAAPDRLEFHLDKPLPPGRKFAVRPAGDAELQIGRKLAGDTVFSFQTRPLELTACQLKTIDRNDLTYELTFNQPVHPQDLLRHVVTAESGTARTLEVTCLTQEANSSLVLRAPRPKADKVDIVLKSGLAGNGAEVGLAAEVRRELPLPTRFCVLNTAAEQPGLDKESTVTVSFSHSLDRTQATPQVKLEPAVKDVRVQIANSALVLRGAFEPHRHYKLAIPANLLDSDAKPLGEPANLEFDVADRPSSLAFTADKGILSTKGRLALDIKAVNVPSIQVQAWWLHANNLASFLQDRHARNVENTSRALGAKTFKLQAPRNVVQNVTLALADVVGPAPRGVYRLEMRPLDGETQNDVGGNTAEIIRSLRDWEWESDTYSAVVCVTDLGLTVKRDRNGYLVWVTSLISAKPVEGVKVSAITGNNQVIATATSDAEGLAVLAIPDGGAKHPDGPVSLITAELDNDLAYIQPAERLWVQDEIDQSGRPAPQTYDVMLYAERGIYRPGETVHLSGIIRDDQGMVPPPFALEVQVFRPDGKKVSTLKVTPQVNQGVFHVDYVSPADGRTGTYRFVATLPGASQELGMTHALVEPFVPVRIQATAAATQERYGADESPEINLAARYLFDQPCAGLQAEITGKYQLVNFTSTKFKDYTFGLPNQNMHKEITSPPTSLDGQGKAVVELDAPSGAKGVYKADITATVTETGGRSVSTGATFRVDTLDRHIGLQIDKHAIVKVGQEMSVSWVLLTGEDALAPATPLNVTLQRVEWDWSIQQVNGRPAWTSVERLIPTQTQKLTPPAGAPSQGVFAIKCPQGGQYRLTVKDAASTSTTSLDFYAADNGSETDGNLVNKPERAEVVLDQKEYPAGAMCKVLVRSPFVGRMLLTLENDRVLERRVVELTGKTAQVELRVPANLRGGAFVNVTIVRPIDVEQSKWLPHRALGMARLSLTNSGHELPLVLEAQAKAQPKDKVHLTLRTPAVIDPQRPPLVHVWAVDEGILMTTRYVLQNPAALFLAPRSLEVQSSDVFADLLPDYKRPAGMGKIGGDGGDEEEAMSMRTSLIPLKNRQSVVVWRTFAPMGPDGRLQLDLDLPRYQGELRFMAVAVDQDRYGIVQKPMTLASPLMAEVSWPRFAAPGDRFDVPVKVFNTTAQEVNAKVTMAYKGPLRLGGPNGMAEHPVAPGELTFDVTIPAGGSVVEMVSASAMEAGDVTVSTNASVPGNAALHSEDEAVFSIRPGLPLSSETRLLTFEAGKPFTIEPAKGFMPGTTRTTLAISASPAVNLRPAVEQLLDYPYGCVEQTTSKLYGMLYAPELLTLEAGNQGRAEYVRSMVQAGISRLWSMQTRNGGLAYWPGDSQTCVWGTAYAAGFLAQAQKAGYAVDNRFSDELVAYVEHLVNSSNNAEVDDNMRAQLCRVLAEFKKPQTAWMSQLTDRVDHLDMAGRANLAGAYLAAGRKDLAAKVLPPGTDALMVAGGRGLAGSSVEQQAVLLGVLLELDPNHAWIASLAQRLEKARTNRGGWGSTAQNALAIAALTKYQVLAARKTPPSFTGTLTLGDGTAAKFDHTKPALWRFKDAAKPLTVQTTGQGTAYVCVQTQGLLAKSAGGHVESYDRGIKVRRAWKDRNGQAIDPAKLRVGDLVQVEVTCEAPGLDANASIENIAIVDALPAAVEIESPNLSTSAPTKGNPTQREEFLDDRVVLFVTARREPCVYNFALRVTTAGEFELPPIQASCMYDAGTACINGGGKVQAVNPAPAAGKAATTSTAPATSRPARK